MEPLITSLNDTFIIKIIKGLKRNDILFCHTWSNPVRVVEKNNNNISLNKKGLTSLITRQSCIANRNRVIKKKEEELLCSNRDLLTHIFLFLIRTQSYKSYIFCSFKEKSWCVCHTYYYLPYNLLQNKQFCHFLFYSIFRFIGIETGFLIIIIKYGPNIILFVLFYILSAFVRCLLKRKTLLFLRNYFRIAKLQTVSPVLIIASFPFSWLIFQSLIVNCQKWQPVSDTSTSISI